MNRPYLDYEINSDGSLTGPTRIPADPKLVGCGKVTGGPWSVMVCIRPEHHGGVCRGYNLDVVPGKSPTE